MNHASNGKSSRYDVMCVNTFTNVSCTASSASVASRNRYSARRIACRWYARHEIGERLPGLVLLPGEHGRLDATGVLGARRQARGARAGGAARHIARPVGADRRRRRA